MSVRGRGSGDGLDRSRRAGRRRGSGRLGAAALGLGLGLAGVVPLQGAVAEPATAAAKSVDVSLNHEADLPPLRTQKVTPPQPGPDPDSVASRAVATGAAYDRAEGDPSNSAVLDRILASRGAFDAAMAEWRGGDTVVPRVLSRLQDAAGLLTDAAGGPIAPAVGSGISGIAQRIGTDHVATYRRAGADRRTMEALRDLLDAASSSASAGDHAGAVGHVGDILDRGPGLLFDMDLFEANIATAFDSRTVGYAYAIGLNGQLARVSEDTGSARTANNAPQTDQSPTKEMNIASVSKTLTAVAVLRLLEQNGLTVDSSISPWLPAAWSQDPSIAGLSFRDLMTHTSGLNGNDGSQPYGYVSLRSATAVGVNAPQTFVYQNLNFSFFRLMIPRLAGNAAMLDVLATSLQFLAPIVGQAVVDASVAEAYADFYIAYMRSALFAPMGIDGDCLPNDAAMTLLYNPNTSSGGINAGDWTLICGSGGWYLSAFEVAAYLAFMRYDNTILSPTMRSVMNQGFLGWMDPAQYNWGDGTWGTYHNHGGDLWWDGGLPFSQRRGMDSCVMSYPNGVQIALLINSQGPSYPGHPLSGYQCAALEDAFENAWVLVP